MKKQSYSLLIMMFSLLLFISCSDDEEDEDLDIDENEFVGQDGNPRFNLQFNNEDDVDLDLYVKTPEGSTIFFGNSYADGGELDVDCLCGGCSQGPTENIYWEDGTAASGEYEYWVDYYGSCGSTGASSDYELRVIQNGEVLTTKSGTLSEGTSTVWTHTQP